MSFGATQVYLIEVEGSLIEAQATCRVWELRGFTVISVTPVPNSVNTRVFLIAMRASSDLYVNWIMRDEKWQAGPFDGQAEAEEAERAVT